MPIAPHFSDPGHWRQRAEEVRVLAEETSGETAKATMLRIAGDYDKPAAGEILPAATLTYDITAPAKSRNGF